MTIYCHGWHTFFDEVTIQRLSKAKMSVLQALISCHCYDFVSVQLINVEAIHVCVACVVIIENTLSKKAR